MKFRNLLWWIVQCEEKFGRKPSIIPISELEMMEIVSDFSPDSINVREKGYGRNQIYGIDSEVSPWAEMTRIKMLEMGVERICAEQKIDERTFRLSQDKSEFSNHLHQQLTAYILTDVTHLDVSFDWDRLAWLKRRVKWIGRRWPVKKKTVRIEGKVLYPYLKIQAPADMHKVRFALSQ